MLSTVFPGSSLPGRRSITLSTDAKLLYGLLLEPHGHCPPQKRAGMTIWGVLFIYYTAGRDTRRTLEQRAMEKAVRLPWQTGQTRKRKVSASSERVKQGQGPPPLRFYVKRLHSTRGHSRLNPLWPQDISHIVFIFRLLLWMGPCYRDQLKDYYGGTAWASGGPQTPSAGKHGLSNIEPSELPGRPGEPGEWEAARQGTATVRDLIRQDVDEAIRPSLHLTMRFLSQLRRKGYRVKLGPRGTSHTASLHTPVGKGISVLDSLKDG